LRTSLHLKEIQQQEGDVDASGTKWVFHAALTLLLVARHLTK